jgi:hypothetical protein
VTALTGNPNVPALVTLTAAIAALQTAETAALARTKGAVITRNEKRLALVQLLQQLKGPIQARRMPTSRTAPRSSRAPGSR